MLNSPMLSIFQHFHAIPLRSPLISLRSKWRLTGFSRRFTPKNPVRLHNPFGALPRWGAKNVLPLNLIALPTRGRGTALAVDRVLSQTAYLRRSPPLFFIPLEPYLAHSARHLPHTGKALCRRYRFPPANLRPFGAPPSIGRRECTCQQKLDTKLKKLGIKIEYLYKIQ